MGERDQKYQETSFHGRVVDGSEKEVIKGNQVSVFVCFVARACECKLWHLYPGRDLKNKNKKMEQYKIDFFVNYRLWQLLSRFWRQQEK